MLAFTFFANTFQLYLSEVTSRQNIVDFYHLIFYEGIKLIICMAVSSYCLYIFWFVLNVCFIICFVLHAYFYDLINN